MDKFKTHYLNLPVNERESLAQQAGTTRGMLNQMVYGGKKIEIGLADCLVALCPDLTLEDLPLTDRAKRQHLVRNGEVPVEDLDVLRMQAEPAPSGIAAETKGQVTDQV